MNQHTEPQSIYYYIRDELNHPVVTVCLLIDGKKISRGIAVCSKQESPDKKYGQALAFKRAKQGMKTKDKAFIHTPWFNRLPIVRDEILIILDKLHVPNDFYSSKGQLKPFLTEYELELLSKNTE